MSGYRTDELAKVLHFTIVVAFITISTKEEHIIPAEYAFHFPLPFGAFVSKLQGCQPVLLQPDQEYWNPPNILRVSFEVMTQPQAKVLSKFLTTRFKEKHQRIIRGSGVAGLMVQIGAARKLVQFHTHV